MNSLAKYFIVISVGVLTLASCAGSGKSSIPANKKEVMDRFVAGTLDPSYAPAAFFIHFGRGKTVGEAAVQAQLEYLVASDMDILKVQFEQFVPRVRGLDTDEGWDSFEPIPVDFYRPTLEIITRLQQVAGRSVYVLPTIYNTYQVAQQGLTFRGIVEGAKNHPQQLKKMLDSYSDALVWLIKECKAIGVEGFYLPTQGGETKFYDIPGFFDTFIKPYDLKVMGEANNGTKMNILHICDWEGTYDDLAKFADYPGQIVNTPMVVDGQPFSLEDGVKLFKRPVLGGFNRQTEILSAPESQIAAMVKDILATGPKGKVMIGADCTVSEAPIGNIQTAVYTAHHNY